MRRFEFVEGTSSKFWEISVTGTEHTVRYGKRNTQGQSKTKSFATAAEAQAAAAKLVAEKLRGGYLEIAAPVAAAVTPSATVEAPTAPDRPVMPPAVPRDGAWVEYFPGTSTIRVEGHYRAGLRHGTWKKFAANGQILEDYTWEDGLPHGPELDWQADGTPACVGQNLRGVREGTWTWWHENGKFFHRYHYAAGKRQGDYRWDLPDGSPRARGQFRDDAFDGAWTWWSEGTWDRLERVYEGTLFHGPERGWFPGGVLGLQRTWRFGKKHGLEESWDATGRPLFRGVWDHGIAIGTHQSWDSAGTESQTRFVGGLPQTMVEDAALQAKVLRDLSRARNDYAKRDALKDHVGYGNAALYAVHLWRTGTQMEPALWDLYAEGHPVLSGEEVLRFISGLHLNEGGARLLPGWPDVCDRLVLEVYPRDPQPFDAALPTLPPLVQRGIQLARARLGQNIGTALHPHIADLALQHAEHYGLSQILWPKGSTIELLNLTTGLAEPTPQLDQLLGWFGGRAAWVKALAPHAEKEVAHGVSRLNFRIFRDLIAAASPAEMSRYLQAIALDNDTQDVANAALRHWRHDPPEVLAQIALGVQDTGLRKWPPICAAILAYSEAGHPIPDDLAHALTLADESPGYTSSWHSDPLRGLDDAQKSTPAYHILRFEHAIGWAVPRCKLLRAAMEALNAAQRRRVIEQQLATPYGKAQAAQYLYTIDDPALWERAFTEILAAGTVYPQALYGFGELGSRFLPVLARRFDKAKKTERKGLAFAIAVAMARGVMDGGVDPAFDRYLLFDHADDYDWRAMAPFVERALWFLPPARAEAILQTGLRSSAFHRAFALIGCAPTATVLATAFTQLLAREDKLKREGQDAVRDGLRSLPDAAAWVRWVLQAKGGSGVRGALEQAVGTECFVAIEAELAAGGLAPVATLDDADKIRLLAGTGGTDRIYLLRKLDGPSTDLNRIGGLAPGVDASRWPHYDDLPMTHLYTLDVTTMPGLVPADSAVRAISVFRWSPSYNEAYDADTDQTAVLLTTAAQLAAGGDPPAEVPQLDPAHFAAVAVDVPDSTWTRKNDLRDAIYRYGARVLGQPIWLQSPEHHGRLIMQFDESFVPINLGDMGIMYVFEDAAFWQCH